jgi:glycolate oxidase FAD binding subunit
MAEFAPCNENDLAAVLADARDRKASVEVVGGGSLRDCGRPVTSTDTLTTSMLAGVVDYQPDELMLTVRPGTTLNEIEAMLAARGQCLAFEPVSYAALNGGDPARTTIGGVIGANLSGPRRFRAGAARDHVLAVRGVTARGEMFKGGGKVVKNVTGYDIPKLMTGAFGTLAVVSELTVKVMPRPRAEITALRTLDSLGSALQFMRAMAASPGNATAIALLAQSKEDMAFRVAIRFEGHHKSIIEQAHATQGAFAYVESEESASIWREVAAPLAMSGRNSGDSLWMVMLAPSDAEALLTAAAPERFLVDHAGGRICMLRPSAGWRPVPGGMNALLVRGPAVSRAQYCTGGPFSESVRAISARIKAQFDPQNLLNPGRLMQEPA